MKRMSMATMLGVAAALTATAIMPIAARADDASRQKHKNNWRNGAIGAGAVALYGLHKHDTTTTVLGAAGAAYSAKRYEEERHNQDQTKRARLHARYHHSAAWYRHHHKHMSR